MSSLLFKMKIINPKCSCLLWGQRAKTNKLRETVLMTQKKQAAVRLQEHCSWYQHHHLIIKVNFSKKVVGVRSQSCRSIYSLRPILYLMPELSSDICHTSLPTLSRLHLFHYHLDHFSHIVFRLLDLSLQISIKTR